MSRKRNFPLDAGVKEKAAVALFGKWTDPRTQKIFSSVALWPDSEKALSDSVGNYAKVIRWTAKVGKRRRQFTEARIHPATDALLDIIVPALCKRDSKPFKTFALAIEAMKSSRFPDLPVAFHAVSLACELTGYAPPFSAAGESQPSEFEELPEAGVVSHGAKGFLVPVSESEFRRRVSGRCKQTIDPGNFNRLCRELKITFAKDPAKGGRKHKS